MNDRDDAPRFTIHAEEPVPESIYTAEAENLRIEKLSTRVTLVAVLIPCLLVIVLAVAYLDIKNRVANTQNTGSMGVQNLSKDLESRFSSLSLKQAKLEEQLAENTKTVETATAALQVNLKKAVTEFSGLATGKADRTALEALSKRSDSTIAGLQKDMADLNDAFTKFDEELAGQIQLMAQGLQKDQERLASIEKKTQQLESTALSKPSLDLALGLERLSLQEMVKDRIREVEMKLTALGKQIDQLNQRLDSLKRQQSSASSPTTIAPGPAAPPARSSEPPAGSAPIKEQTID